MPIEPPDTATEYFLDLQKQARDAGDRTEAVLASKLERLNRPVAIRRFDVFADQIAEVAMRTARTADCFIASRPPSGDDTSREMIEEVLLGGGRHLVLISDRMPAPDFKHALVGWNDSREAARAAAEAIPYLSRTESVTVVVVNEGTMSDLDPAAGADLTRHLRHFGIEATLEYPEIIDGSVSATLIEEAQRRQAGLIVIGGYGHSRLRERIFGGVTSDLLQQAPVPLLVAH
jgi:nucleotide-binding universal stress UspA family protein